MGNQPDKNNSVDLSALDFGPAWARNDTPQKKNYHEHDNKSSDNRGDRRRDYDRPAKKKFTRRREPNAERPPRREHDPLPEGVKASIMPIEEGVDNLVKEITASGRTYSIFDLARLILKSRDRYNVCFTVAADSDIELYQANSDKATFLKKEEALSHFSASEKFSELYKSVEVEAEAPKGNFPSIACCGLTSRHEASFSNMSLERYKSRIQIERDEEKVTQWLELMKLATKFQLTSDETVVFETKADAIQHFKMNGFVGEYPALKKAFVRSDVPFKQISSGLASGLVEIISEQNRYPGEFSSFLCRQLSGRHLAVYKWQNKLHAGPSRPHTVPEVSTLAEKPQAILKWISDNSGKGIDELWKAVLPAEVSDEEKAAWYRDFHWVLSQGYVVLLENGFVHLSSDSKKKPSHPKKGAKKKSSKKQSGAKAQQTAQKPKESEEKPK